MADALKASPFYILFGFVPLGLAIYLFATAKRRVGHWVMGAILLLIAVLSFSASVDIRHNNPYPR
jgi:drug/metabolite transporter (DMT)-like permease